MPRTTPATFMKPQQPDAVLGAIVGTEPLPRTEITKKIWAYIKQHGLQDAKDRRTINAATPEFFLLLGGVDSCSMFDLQRHLSNHYAPAEG